MESELRGRDEVEQLLRLTKLTPADLEGTTQTLFLAQDLSANDQMLLEVSPKLLDSLLANEQSFVLRGEKDDPVVLCTKETSYELREAATSNSLLLVPGLRLPSDEKTVQKPTNETDRILLPKQICSIHHTYWEIREIQPRLRKLRKLLEENMYRGREYEVDNLNPKYTLSCLLDRVQASESQLVYCLADIPAYHVNGFYRLLEFEYQWRVLSFILDLVDSNSWPLERIPRGETLSTLEELEPREILEQTFDQFTEPSTEDGDDLHKLREDRVCRYHAEVLLRNCEKFHLEEFLETWQKSVPEGMTTRPTFLKGIALEDRSSKPETISFFPVSQLPEDITARLNALFTVKEKWTYEEILPYIQDLTSDSLSASALLTKFTRSSTKNGIKMFNTKHPIKK